MLQAYVMRGLHGLGATADPNIKKLQQALAAYATATGYVAANPGPIDGLIGPQTRNAVLAMIPRLPKLPSVVKQALSIGQYAVVVPQVAAQVDSMIKQYAAEISNAIMVLQIVQSPTGAGTSASTTPGSGSPATGVAPWYKTGTGMAAIGVGATAAIGGLLVAALK